MSLVLWWFHLQPTTVVVLPPPPPLPPVPVPQLARRELDGWVVRTELK